MSKKKICACGDEACEEFNNVAIVLAADFKFIEGAVMVGSHYDALEPMAKADLLNDWLEDLMLMYNDILEEATPEDSPYGDVIPPSNGTTH